MKKKKNKEKYGLIDLLTNSWNKSRIEKIENLDIFHVFFNSRLWMY